MTDITQEAALLALKAMEEALIERYQTASSLPIIEYRKGMSSQGAEGYFLSIKAGMGRTNELRPVASQELMRIVRQGFKAMGMDILKLGLERHDDEAGKAVFIPDTLLQQVLVNVGVSGTSQPLSDFRTAVVKAEESGVVLA